MSRALSAEMLAVATADVVRPIYLVKAEFDSTPPEDRNLYLWSGFGNLTFNGKNYLGVGNLLSISAVDESTDLTATGASIVLSGIQSPLLAIARDEDYQGRPITIYLGALDDTGDLIASPTVLFSGFMDVMTISEAGETSTISVTAENKLIAFDRSYVRRYTAEDQKIDYPNDMGFEFVAKIADQEIIWGRASPTSGAGRGSRAGDASNNNWSSH
mgnify:FL=1|jgi:hypothetical protein